MKAVILAAGYGKRMVPLALTQPKPMLPIANTPIIEHILNSLKKAGINDILLITGFLADQIEQYFGDGNSFGLKISYQRQQQISGTASAAQLAEDFVDSQPFLLVYGDILTEEENYCRLAEHYQRNPCPALMSIALVEDPTTGGVVHVEHDKVISVVEKPKQMATRQDFINAGIYIFQPTIFEMIQQTELSERGEFELTTSIQKLIYNNYTVGAFQLQGYWSNVSTPKDILEMNRIILEKLDSDPQGIYIGEGTKIHRKACLEPPLLIGKNCEIDNCFIGRYACIHDNVRIGAYSQISESAILKDTQILGDTQISFATIGIGVRVNKQIVLKGTAHDVLVIPDNSIIG